jgi:hypothetical protein
MQRHMAFDDDDEPGDRIPFQAQYQAQFNQQYAICNVDQKDIITTVIKAAEHVRWELRPENKNKRSEQYPAQICHRYHFLTGDGGTGKTYAYNVQILYL